MRRLLLLAVLAVLAVPGLAHAAPAKISPRGPVVSAAGAASVEVANPNAHVLRGTAAVRTITYKVTGSSQEPGRVAGTLGMSFVDSRYDVFTNKITFVTCSGSQSFEAVPAG